MAENLVSVTFENKYIKSPCITLIELSLFIFHIFVHSGILLGSGFDINHLLWNRVLFKDGFELFTFFDNQ